MASPRTAASSSAPELESSQHVTIRLESLRPGTRLRGPIFEDRTDRDTLLLASGTLLTPSVLQLLQSRGVCQVRVQKSDLSRITGQPANSSGPRTVATDDLKNPGSQFHLSSDSFFHKVEKHGAEPYDVRQTEQFLCDYRESVGQMQRLFEGMRHGDPARASSLANVSSDSLGKISKDIDLFVGMGLKPIGHGALGRHSMQVAMVAMATGTILGLKQAELIDLGVGCMIHDLGMMRIGSEMTNARRRLTTLEFLEVTKHPSITYDLLQEIRDVPTGARMVAYQMHERCNGTGYPRRRTAAQIHPLAKIAAVADVYVALASDRPWRAALTPYKAMEQIILQTRQGLFDPMVVRGLLKTVSLFPIGSCIGTNDGRVGRILRSNGELFTQPVVELWNPAAQQCEILDLAKAPGVEVTKSLSITEMPEDWIAQRAASDDFWE